MIVEFSSLMREALSQDLCTRIVPQVATWSVASMSIPLFQGVSQLSCAQSKSKKKLRQFYASENKGATDAVSG